MSKKAVLYTALVAMALANGAQVMAKDPIQFLQDHPVLKHAILGPSFAFLGASAYALSYAHPVAKPTQKGEWKGLVNMRQLFSDPRAYGRNASEVFWTRWVGQPFKDKELKANPETGKIKQSVRKPATGVMGWTNTYVYTGIKAGKLLGALGAAYLFLTEPSILFDAGTYFRNKFGFAKDATSLSPDVAAGVQIDAGINPEIVAQQWKDKISPDKLVKVMTDKKVDPKMIAKIMKIELPEDKK